MKLTEDFADVRPIEEAATRLLTYFKKLGEGEEVDYGEHDPEKDMELLWDTLSGVGLLRERQEVSASSTYDTSDTVSAAR